MKTSEFRKLIREEVRKALNESKTKTILGIQFNIVPAYDGVKFEFRDVKKFRKSKITVNDLVDEITKMLDAKFGEGTFVFKQSGRFQDDPSVNGLEFIMDTETIFKNF